MVEALQSWVCCVNIWSCRCRCRRRSSIAKSRPSEVYMIPTTKLRVSCYSSPRVVGSALSNSLDCGSVVLPGFRYDEQEEVLKDTEVLGKMCRHADGDVGRRESASASRNRLHFLEEMDEEVLSRRVLVLSRTNKVRSALELYNSMELSGLYPNKHSCNSLLSCLLRRGRLDDALRVFKSMVAKGATTGHSYSLILKAVAEAVGCDSSLEMFVELEQGESSRKVFDAVVYNTMISICARTDDWMQCEKLWGSMRGNGLKGTEITYSLLISIFVRCGQNDIALQAYHEMVQSGLRPGSDVSQAVIKACVKEGEWQLALEVFETMFDYDARPNLVTCNALINSLGKAGEVQEAFKVYSIMKTLGHEPDAFTVNALVGALYRAGRPSDALRLFDSISRENGFSPNLHVYNTALMSCSKLGSWDRAIKILWQIEESGVPVPVATYNLVIATCEVARKPKVAVQVYRHMMDKNCSPDTFTNLSIIRSCVWGSLWDRVEEILKVAPDVSLYNTAIQGMCLRGKIDLAKALYKKMREKGLQPDGKTRALMLQKLTRR